MKSYKRINNSKVHAKYILSLNLFEEFFCANQTNKLKMIFKMIVQMIVQMIVLKLFIVRHTRALLEIYFLAYRLI
jgi:hypothetical protein